jgi:hypothetical protein
MKRIAVIACTVLGLALGAGRASASWGHLCYSGYQPWWNIFAKRYKCLTPEEERLQKFWHDYYDAMKCFYCAMDHIDWVAYYKNHGYQINGGCGPGGCGVNGCGRINYAPVFVSPTIQWAVPNGAVHAPPPGPGSGGGYAVPPMHAAGQGLPPGAVPVGTPSGHAGATPPTMSTAPSTPVAIPGPGGM